MAIRHLTHFLRVLRARTALLRGHGQDGFATIFVILIVSATLMAAGFVADLGMDMDGWVNADDTAQQAARAGAQALDLTVYRETGQTVLNAAQAEHDAETFLTTVGATGTVSVSGTTVTVTVTHVQHTHLLALVGITTLTTRATEHATAEQTT